MYLTKPLFAVNFACNTNVANTTIVVAKIVPSGMPIEKRTNTAGIYVMISE